MKLCADTTVTQTTYW